MTLVMVAYLPLPDVSMSVTDGRSVIVRENAGRPPAGKCVHYGPVAGENVAKMRLNENGTAVAATSGNAELKNRFFERFAKTSSWEEGIESYFEFKYGFPTGRRRPLEEGLCATIVGGKGEILKFARESEPSIIRLSGLPPAWIEEPLMAEDGAGLAYLMTSSGCGAAHFKKGEYPPKDGFNSASAYDALSHLLELGNSVAERCAAVNDNFSVALINPDGARLLKPAQALEYARELDTYKSVKCKDT